MLSGVTVSALAITGTAVLRIVVSSDSMKKATATNQGSIRLIAFEGAHEAVVFAVNARLPSESGLQSKQAIRREFRSSNYNDSAPEGRISADDDACR